jgi:hypothetical protein
MWEKRICFKILTQHLPRRTEKMYENSCLRKLSKVFSQETFRMLVTHFTTQQIRSNSDG